MQKKILTIVGIAALLLYVGYLFYAMYHPELAASQANLIRFSSFLLYPVILFFFVRSIRQ